MTTPDTWPDLTDITEVVLGEVDGALYVMPERAIGLYLGLLDAIRTATTWGDLEDRLRALDPATEEWFLGHLRDDYDTTDEFASDDFPGYADGDNPPHPGTYTTRWVPDHLVKAFGSSTDTNFNGTLVGFGPAHEQALVAGLTTAGFTVRRDDELFRRAIGWS